MADDSDYTVPCMECGGWIRYVYDVQMPHRHLPRKTGKMTDNNEEKKPATPEEILAKLTEAYEASPLKKFIDGVNRDDSLGGLADLFGRETVWAEVRFAEDEPSEAGPEAEKDPGVQQWLLTENERVYDYGHHTITLHQPRSLRISESGNHRIQTADGKLHILSPGWVAIHIDDSGKGWLF